MCQGGNAGGLFVFGGEFSSPKQGTFYHYNDFWRLDPATREWTKIEGKNGPPARSGHRYVFSHLCRRLVCLRLNMTFRTDLMQHDLLQELYRLIWRISRHKPADQISSGCLAVRYTKIYVAFARFPSGITETRCSIIILPSSSRIRCCHIRWIFPSQGFD